MSYLVGGAFSIKISCFGWGQRRDDETTLMVKLLCFSEANSFIHVFQKYSISEYFNLHLHSAGYFCWHVEDVFHRLIPLKLITGA